jgi:hypothetical protein
VWKVWRARYKEKYGVEPDLIIDCPVKTPFFKSVGWTNEQWRIGTGGKKADAKNIWMESTPESILFMMQISAAAKP